MAQQTCDVCLSRVDETPLLPEWTLPNSLFVYISHRMDHWGAVLGPYDLTVRYRRVGHLICRNSMIDPSDGPSRSGGGI